MASACCLGEGESRDVDLGFSSGEGCKQGKGKRVRANACCTQLRKEAVLVGGILVFPPQYVLESSSWDVHHSSESGNVQGGLGPRKAR